MKEPVLHSGSVILLQAELILSVVSRPKCCLSRRPAKAADAGGEPLIWLCCSYEGWLPWWQNVSPPTFLSRPLPPPSPASLSPKMGHWEVAIIRITNQPHTHTHTQICARTAINKEIHVHAHRYTAAMMRISRPPEVFKHAELQIFPRGRTTQLQCP